MAGWQHRVYPAAVLTLCVIGSEAAPVARTRDEARSRTLSPPSVTHSQASAQADRTPVPASLRWVPIPAGSFQMGCEPINKACRQDQEPRHAVWLTRAFEMIATEVTVRQFRLYSAATGYQAPLQPPWNTETHPVVNVTWDEARAFCEWAGGRLPTEAEWEYAARGGTDGLLYPWGSEFSRRFANATDRRGRDAWEATAPVGSFPPNRFGLFDMVGNVWEWVQDWYAGDYYTHSPPADPPGPSSGTRHVIRGGSWDSEPPRLILSFRSSLSVVGRYNLYVGFRCVRAVRPGRP